jgi:hypothetical protein
VMRGFARVFRVDDVEVNSLTRASVGRGLQTTPGSLWFRSTLSVAFEE